MLYTVDSRKSVEEVEKEFPAAAARHNMGTLGVHNLRQKMTEKGVPFDQDCLIFEVCNPRQAKKVLENDMSLSTALPCRVSVYREGGRTKISTIKPTALIELFSNPGLKGVAQEVEDNLVEAMKEMV